MPINADLAATSRARNDTTLTQPTSPVSLDGQTTHQNKLPLLWIDEEQLVNLYYLNFHPSHPILLPKSHYWNSDYPRALKAVVELIGSHFAPTTSSDTCRQATEREIEHESQHTPELVQARLLYALLLFARNEMSAGQRMLAQVIEIAVKLGMHHRDFATSYTYNQPVKAESMRRTWYELYVVDGCIAAFQRERAFITNTVGADVILPCEDSTYEQEICLPSLTSCEEFQGRMFSDKDLLFSSFSFRIEAVRILGRVLTVTGAHGVHKDQVQAIDNALAAFLHHLPISKRESHIINTYGELDELMFQAHTIIQYATILLHFPRGDLASPDLRMTEVPGGNSTKFVCPCARQRVHSMKAIEASRSISMLASLRVAVQTHSPLFVYPLALSAIVQLSVSAIHSRGAGNCLEQHYDRITLILGVLKSMSRYWPVTETFLRPLKRVASALFQIQHRDYANPIGQEDVQNGSNNQSMNYMAGNILIDNVYMQDLHELFGLDIEELSD